MRIAVILGFILMGVPPPLPETMISLFMLMREPFGPPIAGTLNMCWDHSGSFKPVASGGEGVGFRRDTISFSIRVRIF